MNPRRARARNAIIGFAVGIALIAAAAWMLVGQADSLSKARAAAVDAPWWLVAAMLLTPVANAAVVAWSFQIIMNRFGRVPFGDMAALIGSAWLLNYLPMRPGLVGRLAYHKAVHKVSFRNSIAVSVALALMTGLAAGHLLAVWLAFLAHTGLGIAVTIVSIGLVLIAANIAADRSPAGAVPRGALRLALALRYVDLAIWALRFVIAFEIVGEPIPFLVGLMLAAAVQLAYLFPLTGAGLGVVEWAVAFVAPLAVPIDPATAIAAALVNRAAELAAAVPVGLLAGAAIAKRRKKLGLRDPSGHSQALPPDSVPPAP
ncbi:MAG: hypothetical protein AAFO89_03095 [Planctomycetota bacterium]